MGTCLFAKPLLSNGCSIFAYIAVVVQQRVYMHERSVKDRISFTDCSNFVKSPDAQMPPFFRTYSELNLFEHLSVIRI
jgi:hypothetical protein